MLNENMEPVEQSWLTKEEDRFIEWCRINSEAAKALVEGRAAVVPLMFNNEIPLGFVAYGETMSCALIYCTIEDARLDKQDHPHG